jgi:pimeloyl-ACP methyl ester carboxylesterase
MREFILEFCVPTMNKVISLRHLIVALVFAGPIGPNAVSAATAAAAVPRATLSECTIKDLARPARCGSIDVPENPEQPLGRQLPLRIVVVPARNGHALPDPIVPLGGGPGEAATEFAGEGDEEHRVLTEDHDLLFVDQRGTGGSNALRCKLYSAEDPAANVRDMFPPQMVQRCLQEVSAHADLTQYSSARFADDLETVRRALGYGPLNLFALSYGTRAAQAYARAYPKSVRTMYLGSIVPIDIATPLPFARAAQDALERTFDACDADKACHAAYPALRKEFAQVVAALDSGRVEVPLPGSKPGAPLSRGRFGEFLRSKLYKPESAAEVPWLIHQAATGNWAPVGEHILTHAREADAEESWGLFLAITCNEDVAFLREADIEPQTRGTVIGDYRVRNQQAACSHWPRYALTKNFRAPFHSDVPTLIVSGDLDPATPLAFTRHIAPGFSQRFEVILHGQAHSGWSDCVARLYDNFVRSGTTHTLKETCEKEEPRPPFKV